MVITMVEFKVKKPEVKEGGSCKRAIMAAAEILAEHACADGTMVTIPVADGLMIWMPEEAIKEIGYAPHSPETEEEIQKAIEACMKSEWMENWSRALLGYDVPKEVLEQFKRRMCERIYRKYGIA